jgi:hypothetical protein
MKKILVLASILLLVASFVFATDENPGLKEFKNNAYNVSIKYPEGWYTKESNANVDQYYLFVMKEKVEGKEPFHTGYSLGKVYDAKKNVAAFKSYVPKDVAEEFLGRYTSGLTNTTSLVMAFAVSPIMVGEDECYITELYFTDNYGEDLGVFLVTGYKNDTLINMTLQAPREKFIDYRKLYLRILKEAKVF